MTGGRGPKAMLRYDNFHSTLVAWLKVLLPLVALGILSTLFLVARDVDPEAAIPFAEVDVDERAREPRLTQPTWAGVTSDGAALTVHAEEVRPATGDSAGPSVRQARAILESPSGARTEIAAGRVVLDAGQSVATLSGGVTIVTSEGYRAEMPELRARLDRTEMDSDGPVSGAAPAGTIEAGALRIRPVADAPGMSLLVFDKGVRLVYDPAP